MMPTERDDYCAKNPTATATARVVSAISADELVSPLESALWRLRADPANVSPAIAELARSTLASLIRIRIDERLANVRKEFRRVARGIGLVGQMAATTAGPQFEEAMRPILEEAGPLPHGRLQSTIGASSHSSRRKRQHSSRVKCGCNTCCYVSHTTRRWLDSAGAPLCPKHGQMNVQKSEHSDRATEYSQHHRAELNLFLPRSNSSFKTVEKSATVRRRTDSILEYLDLIRTPDS